MDNMGFLFAANAFVWGGVIFYLLTLRKRSQNLRKELDQLKAFLEEDQKS